jgi:hypothetical protein
MNEWWPPILQTAIGGLIGALGAVFGGAFGSWFSWQKERQSLAAAFAGEIEAVKAIAQFRRYEETIQWCIEQTNANNKVTYLTFSVDEHAFPAFEQNVGKIGHLPPDLARDVTLFYSYAKSLVQDFRTIEAKNLYEWPVPLFLHYCNEILRLLDTATKLADALLPKLRKEAARDWKRVLEQN